MGACPLFPLTGAERGLGTVPSPVGCSGWVTVQVLGADKCPGTDRRKYHPCHSLTGASKALPWRGGPLCHFCFIPVGSGAGVSRQA